MRVEGLALTPSVFTDTNPFCLVLERKYTLAYVLDLAGMEFPHSRLHGAVFGNWGQNAVSVGCCCTVIAQL